MHLKWLRWYTSPLSTILLLSMRYIINNALYQHEILQRLTYIIFYVKIVYFVQFAYLENFLSTILFSHPNYRTIPKHKRKKEKKRKDFLNSGHERSSRSSRQIDKNVMTPNDAATATMHSNFLHKRIEISLIFFFPFFFYKTI